MLKHVCVALAVACIATSAAAQAPARSQAGTVKPYVAPRTPWGDPDLQGTYTNVDEQATPMERPAEFDGRRLDSVTSAELKALTEKRHQQAVERAPFVGGDPAGKIGAPVQFREFNEILKASRAWLIVDPPEGKIPSLRPEAQRRVAARPRTGSSFSNGIFDRHQDFSLWERCITRGYPGSMLPGIYGNSYEIVQGPGYVAVRYEMIHETRVIPIGNRPHIGSALRLDMGDARGRWEGQTLVVETTNFRERSVFRDADPRTLTITERFTRTRPGGLEWMVTVDDPSTWVRPWTFSVPLTARDSEAVFEYACHEGNYAMSNMLSGSRAAEKDAESKK